MTPKITKITVEFQPLNFISWLWLMSLHGLVDYYDSHPEHQEEIILANGWGYWQMEFNEMIDELDKEKPFKNKSQRG